MKTIVVALLMAIAIALSGCAGVVAVWPFGAIGEPGPWRAAPSWTPTPMHQRNQPTLSVADTEGE